MGDNQPLTLTAKTTSAPRSAAQLKVYNLAILRFEKAKTEVNKVILMIKEECVSDDVTELQLDELEIVVRMMEKKKGKIVIASEKLLETFEDNVDEVEIGRASCRERV